MSYLPVLIMFILFALGVPVAFSLIAAAISYFLFINTSMPINLIIQRLISSAESFPLLAVPFFITAGSVMNYAGISSRLMDMAEVLSGHLRGGLAQVNVVLSALMGGISGSSNADAAVQCKILVPQMTKRGFGKEFSAAITAASSVISPIIPPGIGLIIYGFIANVSIGKMFIAGYIPGILMCVALMIVVRIVAIKRQYPTTRDTRASFGEIIKQIGTSSFALFLPFGIIMGLRFGAFTPTEAGAMTVAYSLVIGFFVYKELKIEHLPKIIKESVLGTSSVMLIICAASAFGYYMSWERIPHTISMFIIGMTESPILFLLIVNLFLLFLGMFIEGTASLIILTPLLVPTAVALGIDPVHFGIIMVMNLTIGGVTPPFGTMIFLTSSILELKPSKVIKETLPMLVALIGALMLVTYSERFVMYLPNLIMK
ncbi:TRAP transporter large permease [Marispirochaeta sp.]|jgi:tripartite ATP-independent transporter DctM subunit|uniref:TRAP transporter large permease n=1 Tax=Marispirochaeta sp. TaxID=2038653 RepID=UPI0029C7A22D|nr:TRAP transporter large permease [Marispirochaeta sp.]